MEGSFRMAMDLPRFSLKCSRIFTTHDNKIRNPGENHKQMLKPTFQKKFKLSRYKIRIHL